MEQVPAAHEFDSVVEAWGQHLLRAFNGKEDMVAAFKWPKEKILDFFDRVTAQPGPRGYDVEAGSQKSLDSVVLSIHKLVKQTTSKESIFLSPPLSVTYQKTEFKLETIFDLIGWMFSVTGTSPDKANRNNYYYPLAALYCVFWRRLTEKTTINPPLQHDPSMVQMTWFTQGGKTRICISSTLDGINRDLKDSKNAARLRRQDELIKFTLIPKEYKNKSLVESPNPQLFGHCAETTPFLFIKSIVKEVTAAEGFALKPKLILPDRYKEEYKYARLDYRVLRPPCENCSYLVTTGLGFKLKNFDPPT
ncbi:hypothetical protein BV22DRAFT_184460 [Leucogyrophana mollusca]|uniref:Uncharacterized protein n=1 Tax=Leucogyrophana mollusca TaxID=85980 RepID=A0ACB8BRR8_9AGAM|nr:hypothetical protein BV22DRAFT_184460 [Leucogyrophana mollusca]